MLSTMLNAVAIVSCGLASMAFAINHDETFSSILDMVTSASTAEREARKDNFCKPKLAATMTGSDIIGRAAELATEDFTEAKGT